MAGRGFFAELQRQAKLAAREQEREARAAERAHKIALREAERTYKADERAKAQLARAEVADRKRMAKEARDAHVAAMRAEVEKRNAELAAIYEELDSLLAETLNVDDYVDLNALRTEAVHPPFDRIDLETPITPPAPIPETPEPILELPTPPNGIRALFGKKKHVAAVAEAEHAYAEALAIWHDEQARLPVRRKLVEEQHARAEAERLSTLEAERRRYAEQCAAREAAAAEHNGAIDQLVADLGYGTPDAVQEYVSVVLSNSVYPPHFEVTHDFSFDPASAELQLRVLVPGPDTVPTVKAYKYIQSSDEITSTPLSQKACKDRYLRAVHQVALRSLHEVFEADRRGIIKTISMEVGTRTIDPATGREAYVLFVAVGAARESFVEFHLSDVVPTATLAHLGSALSKDPFGLVAADASGVRRS